jgi:hypothetical protein
MSGSCHFDRVSNEVIVKFWIFGIVIFFNHGQVLKFGAPSRHYKGALTQKEIILSDFRSDFNVCWQKSQNKHSKFDTKFVIRRPVEMTWSEQKAQNGF